jgi:hypothetical protein
MNQTAPAVQSPADRAAAFARHQELLAKQGQPFVPTPALKQSPKVRVGQIADRLAAIASELPTPSVPYNNEASKEINGYVSELRAVAKGM